MITREIAGRTLPTLFDLRVALLSAIAGAYALIRGRGGTVVSIAIAIALTAALVARIYGFGSHLSAPHTGWQIAFEAVAQRQIRDTLHTYFPDGARLGQLNIDYGSGLDGVDAHRWH